MGFAHILFISKKDVQELIIREIQASSSNPPCCQGTAINDPIVSGYILDKAADTIAQQNGGTAIIYTPSRCWKWDGIVGPNGINAAVLKPCNIIVVVFHYV